MRALLAIAVLLSATAAFGQNVITVSPTAPTENVAPFSQTVQSHIVAPGQPWDGAPQYTAFKSRHAGDYENNGATFQIGATDVVVDKITFQIYGQLAGYYEITDPVDVQNVPFRFVLFQASAANDAGGTYAALSGAPDPSTVVAEFTGTAANIAHDVDNWVSFDFNNVTLSANQWYGFYAIIDGYSDAYAFQNAKQGSGGFSPSYWLRYADQATQQYIAEGGDDTVFWVQTGTLPSTLLGDANHDGAVNFDDYLILESTFGGAPELPDNADFDGSGTVDFDDYLTLEANFGNTAVPEPMTLSMLALGGLALIRRRR